MLICVDFDETITKRSIADVHGHYAVAADIERKEIIENLRNAGRLSEIIRAVKATGHKVCITTQQTNTKMIELYLQELLGEDWKEHIETIIWGSARDVADRTRVVNTLGKNTHIYAALAELGFVDDKTGELTCDEESVVLVDDNLSNCKAAIVKGFVAIWVNAQKDFTADSPYLAHLERLLTVSTEEYITLVDLLDKLIASADQMLRGELDSRAPGLKKSVEIAVIRRSSLPGVVRVPLEEEDPWAFSSLNETFALGSIGGAGAIAVAPQEKLSVLSPLSHALGGLSLFGRAPDEGMTTRVETTSSSDHPSASNSGEDDSSEDVSSKASSGR